MSKRPRAESASPVTLNDDGAAGARPPGHRPAVAAAAVKDAAPGASGGGVDPADEEDAALLQYQRAQLAAESRARAEEIERLRASVVALERQLAEHEAAAGRGGAGSDEAVQLSGEQRALLIDELASAKRARRLEEELEDARQALAQTRRMSVRLECGVSVSGEAAAAAAAAPAPRAQQPQRAEAREGAPAAAAKAEQDGAGSERAAPSDEEQQKLLARCDALANELEEEKQARTSLLAEVERYAADKASLAGELEGARQRAAAPEDETVQASALYRGMEARTLLLLRAEQQWQQEREQLARERDELLRLQARADAAESKTLEQEVSTLQRRVEDRSSTIEQLKKETARWQLLYEEKKRAVDDSKTVQQVSDAMGRIREEKERLESQLTELRRRFDDGTAPETSEFLAEIESLSSSLSAADDNVAKLTRQLAEKEAALGRIMSERLKLMQQQLTLKEQVKVSGARADKEKELTKQTSTSLATARTQVSELQAQMGKVADEMRVVRRQLAEAQRGAAKSAEAAAHEKKSAEVLRNELRSVREQAQRLASDAETRQGNAVQLESDKAAVERRLARAERELESARKSRIGGGSGGLENWQLEMMADMRRKLYCTICNQQEKAVTLTRCLHMFCRDCIDRNIANRNRKCPVCGERFGVDDVKPIFF